MGRRDSRERAAELMQAVGLDPAYLDRHPGELSGGEQQRVAMARAFVAEPTILLADEPTGNLDGATGRAVLDVLFAVHKRLNTTLILVTHQPEVADRCARVVHLTDGRIAGDRQRRSRP